MLPNPTRERKTIEVTTRRQWVPVTVRIGRHTGARKVREYSPTSSSIKRINNLFFGFSLLGVTPIIEFDEGETTIYYGVRR